MLGMKPRNDMKVKGWYFAITATKPLTHTDNPIEFMCKYINKRREVVELVQRRLSNSSGGYLETNSTIEFKQNAKIVFSESLPTSTSPFVKVQREGIDTKFKEDGISSNKYGLKRNQTQAVKFG